MPCGSPWSNRGSHPKCLVQSLDVDYQPWETFILNPEWARDPFLIKAWVKCTSPAPFIDFHLSILRHLMVSIPLIGRYLYSHWVLGMHPGGIESYTVGFPPFWALSLMIVGIWGSSPLIVTVHNNSLALPHAPPVLPHAPSHSLALPHASHILTCTPPTPPSTSSHVLILQLHTPHSAPLLACLRCVPMCHGQMLQVRWRWWQLHCNEGWRVKATMVVSQWRVEGEGECVSREECTHE